MEEVSHGFLIPPAHICPASPPGPLSPRSGTSVESEELPGDTRVTVGMLWGI